VRLRVYRLNFVKAIYVLFSLPHW